MSSCSVSFFGEGQTMLILTGLPSWTSMGFNAPSTTMWWAFFLSLKGHRTGLNNHSATARLHFLPRWCCWSLVPASLPPIVPLCLRCLILLPAFCVILWTPLQPRLTYRQRMLTCYLPKFSRMRKLTSPPILFVVAMVTGKELKHQSLPFPHDGLRKLLICLIERQVVSQQLMLEGSSWGEFQPPGRRKLKHLLVH